MSNCVILIYLRQVYWLIKRFILRLFLSDLEYNTYAYSLRFVEFKKDNYHRGAYSSSNKEKLIIFITNSDAIVGGLCDRLRGCISTYSLSKELNIKFKIFWKSPFDIEDYLDQNIYNWRMNNEPHTSFPYASPICVASKYGTAETPVNIRLQEMSYQKRTMRNAIEHSKKSTEFHIYSNAYFGDTNFSDLFRELFKPSIRIQKLIDKYSFDKGNYISISFRFLQLLGDFKEQYGGKVLDDNEKQIYLKDSIALIRKLYDGNRHRVSNVLVASDSETLLKEAQKLDYVFVIPGHISHTSLPGNSFDKEFVDFFMISRACHAYLAQKGDMWMSTFPYYASLVGNIPFSIIRY